MPFIRGSERTGWAVLRNDPRHVAGVYDTEQEANAKAAELGPEYEVRHGQIGDGSDFDEPL